jgi:hypothetical protein
VSPTPKYILGNITRRPEVVAIGHNMPGSVGFGTNFVEPSACRENSKKRNITGEVRRNVCVVQMADTFVMLHYELPPVR